MNTGRRIRDLRQQHGWTQQQLADRSGVSQGHLSAIERSRRARPRIRTLLRLAEALGVPVADLAGGVRWDRVRAEVENIRTLNGSP